MTRRHMVPVSPRWRWARRVLVAALASRTCTTPARTRSVDRPPAPPRPTVLESDHSCSKYFSLSISSHLTWVCVDHIP
jgi:hypothetical protein